MAGKLTLVKFGGSLITDKNKPFSKNISTIARLCRELHLAKKKLKNALIIVGNGGGSFAHPVAKKYGYGPKGIARVQDACARLNRIVVGQFLKAGENAFSINPSSMMIAEGKDIKKVFLEPLLRLLETGILPVVYGDVVLDERGGAADLSTEKILNYLALNLSNRFRVQKVIHVGATAGVYDAQGKTIKRISKKTFDKVKDNIGGSDGIDVTGGMKHKIEESLKLASQKRIKSFIIDGRLKGELFNILVYNRHHGTEIS